MDLRVLFSFDDVQLEAVYERCETGDFLACDVLLMALGSATEPASYVENKRYGRSSGCLSICGDR